MGDDDDGASLVVQLAQQTHDRGARLRVEVAGGLVGEHDRRSVDDGARDGDALTFATAEMARDVTDAVGEPDAFECFGGPPTAFGRSNAAVEQTLRDVLHRAQTVEQEELLEDEPDQLRSRGRQLTVAECRHRHPGDADGARARPVERADDVQQRRLSGSRRSHDGDEFAFVDAQADTVERSHGRRARVVLLDVDDLEGGAHDGTTTSAPAVT